MSSVRSPARRVNLDAVASAMERVRAPRQTQLSLSIATRVESAGIDEPARRRAAPSSRRSFRRRTQHRAFARRCRPPDPRRRAVPRLQEPGLGTRSRWRRAAASSSGCYLPCAMARCSRVNRRDLRHHHPKPAATWRPAAARRRRLRERLTVGIAPSFQASHRSSPRRHGDDLDAPTGSSVRGRVQPLRW